MEQSGAKLDSKVLAHITGSICPLGDRLVLKPLDLKLSQFLIAPWKGRTVRGEVISSGPGEFPNKYNRQRSKTWKSNLFRPNECKPGDIIQIAGMELGGYQFPQYMLNGELVIICSEKDVACIELKAKVA